MRVHPLAVPHVLLLFPYVSPFVVGPQLNFAVHNSFPPRPFRKNLLICFYAPATTTAAVESINSSSTASNAVNLLDDGFGAVQVDMDESMFLDDDKEVTPKDSVSMKNNGEQTIKKTITDDDIARPTANGGFTHTSASRAKISAANKGKTPWNKGKKRSEEVKARIREGVLKRVREKHLQKLEEMGMTEEEWDAEQEKIKAEKNKRKTKKGGYRPTPETKNKISEKLKAKWASGEVKKRPTKTKDPHYVNPRKGVGHSEETKQKIRESLKAKWADPSYREKMEKANQLNSLPENRKRISETLKKKWEDPVFRERMMKSIHNRKKRDLSQSSDHRQKISEAMKKKWQDPQYREKTISGIKAYNDEKAPSTRPPRPRKPATPRKKVVSVDAAAAKPKRQRREKKKDVDKALEEKKVEAKAVKSSQELEKVESESERISRMKEVNNDLYDLLYGDDNLMGEDILSGLGSFDDDDDDDLDDFDPYGLE